MTVLELRDALNALIARDEYLAGASVTYGPDFEPVGGGIIGKNTKTNLVVLNLAPIMLDQMGGF